MSSAALIKDGKLIAAVCEERFTRNKNEMGYPVKSIEYCLEEAKLDKSEIDYVVSATHNLPAFNEVTKRYPKFSIEDYIKENDEYWKPLLFQNIDNDYFSIFPKMKNEFYDFSFLETETDKTKWNELFKIERQKNIMKEFGISEKQIRFIDHHTCHAAYAYFMSPFRDDVLILTADAFGDGVNCTISIGSDNKFETKFSSPNNNLARLYKYITLLLGMKPNEHEYKVMGLAPYATDYIIKKPLEIFSSTQFVNDLEFEYKNKPTDHYFWFKDKLEGCRFDGIAGALQRYVEDMMKEWVTNAVRKFQKKSVVFSGGLAMNIKVNKVISEISDIEKFFVAGGGGDESLSIGAALFFASEIDEKNRFHTPIHDYHGPSIDSIDVEKILLEKEFSDFQVKKTDNYELAELLAQDYIISRCKGRAEFGPRALGNRSILANPGNIDNLRKINEKIKFRDFWMPFTPSLLIETAERYIINPKKILSPYMTIAFDCTEIGKRDLIAAIHPADNTARPQFVDKKYNQDYHDLISKFEEKTGIGGLLNTSMNLHGEPIVGNSRDALHTLVNSDLDAVLIDNLLVTRKK